MSESPIHRKLKEVAIKILKQKGFTNIQLEKSFVIEGKYLRADLFASKKSQSIIVECGETDNFKIDQFKKVASEVMVLRPIDDIEFLEQEITSLQKKCEDLEKEKAKQKPIYLSSSRNGRSVWIKIPIKYLPYIKKMIAVFYSLDHPPKRPLFPHFAESFRGKNSQKKPLEKP